MGPFFLLVQDRVTEFRDAYVAGQVSRRWDGGQPEGEELVGEELGDIVPTGLPAAVRDLSGGNNLRPVHGNAVGVVLGRPEGEPINRDGKARAVTDRRYSPEQ